jgi:hypothetical protein
MIICLFKEQAQLLVKQKTFEVDMSFKRVFEKDINEVIFAAHLFDQGKSKWFPTCLKHVLIIL